MLRLAPLFILLCYSVPTYFFNQPEIKPSYKLKRSELTVESLQLVKGIGPVFARNIINSNGPLIHVKGIGEKRSQYLYQYYIEDEK